MKKAIVIVSVMVFVMAACAPYRPIVDMQNVDPYQYETDLQA